MVNHSVMTISLMMVLLSMSLADDNSGRYNHNSLEHDSGKYSRPKDEGKYIHIPNPYDGGYGPYSGDWEKYKHDLSGHYDGSLNAEASYRQPVSVTPAPTPYPTIKYVNNGNRIIRQNQALKDDGFKYLYETENKILAEEKAFIKNPNTPDEGIASSGYYQFVGPDGILYRTTYTADENGFRPKTVRVKYPESLDDGFTKLKQRK